VYKTYNLECLFSELSSNNNETTFNCNIKNAEDIRFIFPFINYVRFLDVTGMYRSYVHSTCFLTVQERRLTDLKVFNFLIVTGYGLDVRGLGIRLPAGAENFLFAAAS